MRDRIVEVAKSVSGYRAADAYDVGPGRVAPFKPAPDRGTGAAFRELLGPGAWDLSRPFSCKLVDGRYVTKGVSTCGLVAAGILRHAGVPLPWNGAQPFRYPAPYGGLDIVSAFSRLGQLTKATVRTRPRPGDVCCIGSGLATHVLVVIDDDGRTVTSVDGGQVEDAAGGFLQRVKVCRRVWSSARVVWTLDADRLLAALEGAAPVVEPWTVEDTQAALNRHGAVPRLVVDGIAGPNTRAAIVAFQRAHGLVPDGVVGPLTRAALRAA